MILAKYVVGRPDRQCQRLLPGTLSISGDRVPLPWVWPAVADSAVALCALPQARYVAAVTLRHKVGSEYSLGVEPMLAYAPRTGSIYPPDRRMPIKFKLVPQRSNRSRTSYLFDPANERITFRYTAGTTTIVKHDGLYRTAFQPTDSSDCVIDFRGADSIASVASQTRQISERSSASRHARSGT